MRWCQLQEFLHRIKRFPRHSWHLSFLIDLTFYRNVQCVCLLYILCVGPLQYWPTWSITMPPPPVSPQWPNVQMSRPLSSHPALGLSCSLCSPAFVAQTFCLSLDFITCVSPPPSLLLFPYFVSVLGVEMLEAQIEMLRCAWPPWLYNPIRLPERWLALQPRHSWRWFSVFLS